MIGSQDKTVPIEQIACCTRSSEQACKGRAIIETPVTSGANKAHTHRKKTTRKKKFVC